MTGKLFVVLFALFVALPVNAMTIEASDHWLMVQDVSAFNNQREFRLKMLNVFDPFLKDKINDMRLKYNLQYAGILTKHGFAVNDINTDLDAIWRKVSIETVRMNMWILMLLPPGAWDVTTWELYKKRVLKYTKKTGDEQKKLKKGVMTTIASACSGVHQEIIARPLT